MARGTQKPTEVDVQAQDALDEHSKSAVPIGERKSFSQLVFVWIGYVFTVTIMTAGGNIALGSFNFAEAMKALAVGYLVLIILGVMIAFISMKTGLTFGLLCRYTFGSLGSHFIALPVMVTLLGWFSINCYLIGSITNTLVPGIPAAPISILAGVCMTYTALKGLKLMNKLGSIATVLVIVFGVVSIVLALRDVGGLAGLLAITNPNPLPFNKIVSIAVGSVVCGVVAWTPDVMRYAKSKSVAFLVMFVAICICAPFMLLIGIIGMLTYGQSDIAFVLAAQGLLAPAWLAMVANIWSTAQGNVYSSSLNLSNTFRKIPRKYLVIAFGLAGTLGGLFGLYQHFSAWLSLLASTFPALGGVFIADFFFTYRKGYPVFEKAHFMRFNALSFVSFAAGVVANYLVPFGISAINAIIVAFVVQTIFSLVFLKKKMEELNPELPVETAETNAE